MLWAKTFQTPEKFKPLLAAELSTEHDFSRLTFWPYIASPKYDGIRCLLHPDKGPVSRSLKPIPNTHTRHQLTMYMQQGLQGLDGELMCRGTFQNTTSSIMSHDGKPEVVFFIFDTFQYPDMPYEDRLKYLLNDAQSKINEARQICDPRVQLIIAPCKVVNSLEELMLYEIQCLQEGFEGVMLRYPKQGYKYGRSSMPQQHLMKLKRFKDCEARIVGFNELMQNNNKPTTNNTGHQVRSSHQENLIPQNTLGSLRVVAINGPFEGREFNIGTGFDQTQRKHIWDNQMSHLQKIVTFKYQEHGSKDVPRIPVFMRFRGSE